MVKAASSVQWNVVKELLDRGMDITSEARCKAGSSAAEFRHLDMVKSLPDRDIDVKPEAGAEALAGSSCAGPPEGAQCRRILELEGCRPKKAGGSPEALAAVASSISSSGAARGTARTDTASSEAQAGCEEGRAGKASG